MSPELADVTRAQLPRLRADISRLGAIKTVMFNHVGPAGLDVYDVTLANGAIQCGIFVTPDGTIVTHGYVRQPPRCPLRAELDLGESFYARRKNQMANTIRSSVPRPIYIPISHLV
jgi:hypothetical protein